MDRSIAFWEALSKAMLVCSHPEGNMCGSPETEPQLHLCRPYMMAFPRNLSNSVTSWEFPSLLPHANSPLWHEQTSLFGGGNNLMEEPFIHVCSPLVGIQSDLDIIEWKEPHICNFETKISFLLYRRKMEIFSLCLQNLGFCLT